MTKSLVIVESPSKAKTINKYLGKSYIVLASVGHIKDLPKKGLGVDVENDFKPTYEVMPGKEKVVKQLKDAAKDAEAIYVATDPDREGEAIGRHIAEVVWRPRAGPQVSLPCPLQRDHQERDLRRLSRLRRVINDNLVDAQQARRVLDRLVGYQVSPLLWDKVRRGLSAGRVQTVAVRLVVEREREIQAFLKTEYWTVEADISAQLPPAFDARLHKIGELTVKTSGFDNGTRKNEVHISDEATAQRILHELEGATVSPSLRSSPKRRSGILCRPSLPRSSSRMPHVSCDLLRSAPCSSRRSSTKESSSGDEGAVGLITYMRTDSTRVAESALQEAREYIGRQYGPQLSSRERRSLPVQEGRAGRARGDQADCGRAHAGVAERASRKG